MTTIQKEALVPYSPEDMFNLVNNVQDYPNFLPWCHKTEILEQNQELMKAVVHIQKANIKHAFTTKNELITNQRIEMNLVSGPFKNLKGYWTFEPMGQGTKISLFLNFEFASKLLALTVGPVFKQASETMLNAFIQRARDVYA